MADLTIVGLLAVIAFSFYAIIYLLGRIFDAQPLMQLATVNAADAIFTVAITSVLISLIDGNVFQDVAYQILTTPNFVNKSKCDNAVSLSECYNKLYNRAFNNISEFLFVSFNISDDVWRNKIAVMSFSFSGGGGNWLTGALSLGGSPVKGLGEIIVSVIPSSTNTIGVGGGFKVLDQLNRTLRQYIYSVYSLLIFINELYTTFSNTKLIVFLIVIGALMRLLLISKGGGTFLISLALSMNFVFPSALTFSLSVVESTIGMDIKANVLADINKNVEETTNLIYFTTFPKPFFEDPINNLNNAINYENAKIVTLLFIYSIMIGFALFAIISTSAGISSLLGAEVGIWMIAQLGRMA
jgi:hypothetical protein